MWDTVSMWDEGTKGQSRVDSSLAALSLGITDLDDLKRWKQKAKIKANN